MNPRAQIKRIISGLPDLSPSVAIGSLGATELLVTTLSPSQAGGLIGTATESDTVGGILAAASVTGTELGLVADVVGILFFGYAVYEFLPQVFPDTVGLITNRRGYRVLAICFAVILSKTIESVISGTGVSEIILISVGLGVTPVVLCVGYVGIIASRSTADITPASDVVRERLTVSGANGRTNDTETALLRHRLSDVLHVGVFIAAPLPILGITASVVGFLYPLLEGLAIGWAVIGVVNHRVTENVGDRLPSREQVDLEDSGFDLSIATVRSPKGLPTAIITVLGFIGAVIFVGGLIITMPQFVQEGVAAIRSDPLFTWSVIGGVFVLLGSGFFNVWFWARVIRRVPAYLRTWNTSKAEGSPLADESLPEPVSRPVGLLLPFFITVLPAVMFIQTLRFDYFFDLRTPVLAGYGVVWPLSVVLLGWAVYRTQQREPQPVSSDGRALPVALLTEWAVILLLQPIATYVGQASGLGYSSSTAGVGILLVIISMSVFIFIYPDLEFRADNAKGWRSQQENLAMFSVGFTCGVGWFLNIGSSDNKLFFSIIAVLFVGASVWNVAAERLL